MPHADPEARRKYQREYRRKWRAANPERNRQYDNDSKRRMRASGLLRDFDPDTVLMLMGDPYCYCGDKATHVDHITAKINGGSNDWLNATAACERCNKSKADKPMIIFLAHRNGCWEFRHDLEEVSPNGSR